MLKGNFPSLTNPYKIYQDEEKSTLKSTTAFYCQWDMSTSEHLVVKEISTVSLILKNKSYSLDGPCLQVSKLYER